MIDRDFWRGRGVLLTGHTGFKGGWLSLLLKRLGGKVAGIALPPNSSPNMFDLVRVADGIDHTIGDVRSLAVIEESFARHQPEIVFHLAAQSLVRESYRDPVGTYATNVLGTVHVLDAARRCESVRAIIIVTSDKCYANREWVWPYRETDRLGGNDPYSNSKACAELVTDAYRRSFFGSGSDQEHRGAAAASTRAGNVIGGGDWAADRLVPDAVRAFTAGETLVLRNPRSTRPWQHVLDPLVGYLMLAQHLAAEGGKFAEAWNFGPDSGGEVTVEELVVMLHAAWGRPAQWRQAVGEAPHEAAVLRLDSSKARALLGWQPRLSLADAIRLTAEWYRAWQDGGDLRRLSEQQIDRVLATVAA